MFILPQVICRITSTFQGRSSVFTVEQRVKISIIIRLINIFRRNIDSLYKGRETITDAGIEIDLKKKKKENEPL